MSIISKCHYCLPEVNEKRTYRKQTEVYDSIGIDVPMCWNCGEAALFERERIIKLLQDLYLKRDADGNVLDTKHNEDLLYVIALIKGEK